MAGLLGWVGGSVISFRVSDNLSYKIGRTILNLYQPKKDSPAEQPDNYSARQLTRRVPALSLWPALPVHRRNGIRCSSGGNDDASASRAQTHTGQVGCVSDRERERRQKRRHTDRERWQRPRAAAATAHRKPTMTPLLEFLPDIIGRRHRRLPPPTMELTLGYQSNHHSYPSSCYYYHHLHYHHHHNRY